jgi:hypothetical protein
MNPTAQRIIEACENVFDDNGEDCNKFAKAVATRFNVTLTGNANAIVDQIQGDGWTSLANGVEAKGKADDGWLVVGGLKGADQNPPKANGHVVIVVSGPLAQAKYPTAYWGQLGGSGDKNKTVNFAWTLADRDNVIYAARLISS